MTKRSAKKAGTRILKDAEKRMRLEGAKVISSSKEIYWNKIKGYYPSVCVKCTDKNGDTWGWFPGHPAYDCVRYDRFGRAR